MAACATAPPADGPRTVELPPSSVSVAWEPPPAPSAVEDGVSNAALTIGTSFETANERVDGWRSLPKDRTWQQILSREGVDSMHLSVGTTSSGKLQNAAALAHEGVGHAVIERHRNYHTNHGTPELVNAIANAGAAVASEFPGAVLRVGNLSRKNGGDIVWSHSHNSGRDADLAFYVHLVDSGKVVPAPDLMHFDEQGIAKEDPNYRFDVERNWSLIRALLADETINIQWIFVSIPLEELMLSHAQSRGDSSELIERAREVLHQPTDALPHDDHFHLRIGCSKSDRVEGCIDWGPRWAWEDWHDEALIARSLELAKVFKESATTEQKLAALQFLEDIQSPYRADVALIWGVYDEDETVRSTALTVADRAWPWSTASLVAAQRYIESDRSDLAQKAEAYSILRRAMDPIGWEFARDRLMDETVDDKEKVYAARALQHAMDPEQVPFLLEQLAVQPGPVRQELANVLMRTTNHTVECNWQTAGDKEVGEALASWTDWWESHRTSPRDEWLLAGFKGLGVDVNGPLDPRDVDVLLPLLKQSPEHVIYNVNRLVREVTGRWAPLEQVNGAVLYDYWMKWWRKNRARVLSES